MRQHMGKLQHNKIVVVDGPNTQAAVCGSTNHSWRGFFVQNNNAIVLRGKTAVKLFNSAFQDYWDNSTAAGFGGTNSARWNKLGLKGPDITPADVERLLDELRPGLRVFLSDFQIGRVMEVIRNALASSGGTK